MKILITIILVLLNQTVSYAQEVDWKQVAPGIWKGIIGQPEAIQFGREWSRT